MDRCRQAWVHAYSGNGPPSQKAPLAAHRCLCPLNGQCITAHGCYLFLSTGTDGGGTRRLGAYLLWERTWCGSVPGAEAYLAVGAHLAVGAYLVWERIWCGSVPGAEAYLAVGGYLAVGAYLVCEHTWLWGPASRHGMAEPSIAARAAAASRGAT